MLYEVSASMVTPIPLELPANDVLGRTCVPLTVTVMSDGESVPPPVLSTIVKTVTFGAMSFTTIVQVSVWFATGSPPEELEQLLDTDLA